MRIMMREMAGQGGEWRVVQSQGYAREVEMHRLLAEAPSLIPTEDLLDPPSPFVVAVKEFDLPGAGSTDIVLFNPEGRVALVECKLDANRQIKREVVGQILEYAAYLWRMPYDEVDARVQRRHQRGLAELMREAVADPDWDEKVFRQAVQKTLNDGSFSLIIAVDAVNHELGRTIDFVNSCGSTAFSFHALTLPRFQSDQVEILVPDLHGSSSTPPPPPPPEIWTETRFQEEVSKLPEKVAEVVRSLHQWIQMQTNAVRFGTGTVTGSTSFYYPVQGRDVRLFTAYTDGRLGLAYGSFATSDLQPQADAFHSRLKVLSGFEALPALASGYPVVRIQEAFVDHPENLEKFKAAVLAAVRAIEAAQTTGEQP